MSSPLFPVLMTIMVIGLFAVLAQAGIGPHDAPASFWAVVAIADAMGMIGFLWGKDA